MCSIMRWRRLMKPYSARDLALSSAAEYPFFSPFKCALSGKYSGVQSHPRFALFPLDLLEFLHRLEAPVPVNLALEYVWSSLEFTLALSHKRTRGIATWWATSRDHTLPVYGSSPTGGSDETISGAVETAVKSGCFTEQKRWDLSPKLADLRKCLLSPSL
ncbi:unnamed protein product [Protopolystoma xenopodis]|uniref:Uncharacterized protein n=1 Tax=Protopolystoma xenopodis TaxID=117903 RepID=A0A3S5AWI0_9PLAT|nr:unnamed protein product [Protopolystoma xenopodis]